MVFLENYVAKSGPSPEFPIGTINEMRMKDKAAALNRTKEKRLQHWQEVMQ
jgi:hypothetical protein